jgi:hypothetical protein
MVAYGGLWLFRISERLKYSALITAVSFFR